MDFCNEKKIHNEKMTLLGFVSHGRIKCIGASLFSLLESLRQLCHCDVSADSPDKKKHSYVDALNADDL